MLTYSEERALIDDIKEGIEMALYREGYSSEDVDDIKLNKLVYFAIQEFDLDITYGWFKYGPAPVDVADTSGDAGPGISPQPAEEIIAKDRPRVLSEQEDYPSPERYATFYTEFDEFHRILSMDTKEYLEDFYEEYAPETYRDLYLESIKLQKLIDRIPDSLDLTDDDTDIYPELSERLGRLSEEVLRLANLDEVVKPVKDYGSFLKNLVTGAQQQDQLVESAEQYLTEAVEFFYNNTWYYSSLLISQDTVSGANADRLRTSIGDKLGQIRGRYSEDFESLREHARLFGLLTRSYKNREDIGGQNQSNQHNDDFEPPDYSIASGLSYQVINE